MKISVMLHREGGIHTYSSVKEAYMHIFRSDHDLIVVWINKSKALQVLPVLIRRYHAHWLVTGDLRDSKCIDIVSHARGVCRGDKELNNSLFSIAMWNTSNATNSCILGELTQANGLS